MSTVIDNPLFTQEVPDKGAAHGHIRFTLKTTVPADIALAGFCANITASLLFERMQAQGTNLIMQLGKESAAIDVIARNENDGLNLQWQPKQVDPGQMNDIQERIRNKTFFIGKEQPKVVPAANVTKAPVEPIMPRPAPVPEDPSEQEEDQMIKHLHRIP